MGTACIGFIRWRVKVLSALLTGVSLAAAAMVVPPPATVSSAPTEPPEPLRTEPIWLLGEVHDSPRAHRARWRDLAQRVEAGWRPTLVMEHFDRERQAELQAAMDACADAPCVVQRAGGPGWDWPLLSPVLTLALQYRLPVVAGNVSRTDAARVVREGVQAALPTAVMQGFGLPGSLTSEVQAAQVQAVDEGHCGQLPAALLPRMAQAQVARDVWMAHQLLQHARQGVVLLAGNGHVRRDVGVAHWLRQAGGPAAWAVGYEEEGVPVPARRYVQLRRVAPHARPDPCATWRPGSGQAR